MRQIAVTQRVDVISDYGERRDALDQRWMDLLISIDLCPVLVPNNIDFVKRMLNKETIEGVLLTGGNSLLRYGGDAPERDEVERFLLEWVCEKNIPLLGVCRGMQMIQDFFNNDLNVISNHVGMRQSLVAENDCRLSEVVRQYKDVNSYHEYGSKQVQGQLVRVASSLDGVVMAIEHREKNIFGVMWHSEREPTIRREDRALFRKVFMDQE